MRQKFTSSILAESFERRWIVLTQKIDGAWKVGNLLSSFEPNACDELKPPSVGAMRPRDGWRETPLQ